MTLFRWTAEHLARLGGRERPTAPPIMAADVPRVVAGLDLWDHWPVCEDDGQIAVVAGGMLVVALSAPILADPDLRHDVARLRLLHRRGASWRDLGMLLPEDFSSGSREWAGSAILDPATGMFRLFFTATGRRGESAPTFHQRLLETRATLRLVDGAPRLSGWTAPIDIVRPDGADYETDMAGGGRVGTIKAFRDPAFVRDDDGGELILFAGSRAHARTGWNGLVGAARKGAAGWTLLPPVIDATGVSNELERPHAVRHDGRWYLFWSTPAGSFAPTLGGVTGLYGVVGDALAGPWRPLNGHGLVVANPPEAPAQAYSWQVLPDLSVWSFADLVGLASPPGDAATARAHFAGTPAPPLQLEIADDRTRILPGTVRQTSRQLAGTA